jgi:predicted ribosomally synthesized peptide with SipW-like signal peptide
MDESSRIDLTRRKALAAIGSIGVASAGAGLGTSAYFSDQESFENNRLTAGTLDMKVSWEEHYSDWSEDEAEYAHMEDGDLVVDDREGFMNATLQEGYPDEETRAAIDAGETDPCDVLADVPDDLEKPVIELADLKPGDFGEVTFDFTLCENPGYVWLNGGLVSEAENGLTEPEADDPDEGEGVELADEIQVTVWYDDGDNVLEDPETVVTDREFEPNPSSAAVDVSGPDRIVAQGSLRDVLTQLAAGNGVPLDADPTTDARNCFTDSPTVHYLGVAWELPVDHANEIQSDSVTFDIGFYTEQCRHNDGSGMGSDLRAYYPLDEGNSPTVLDRSGSELDGTISGDVTFTGGQVGNAASFGAGDRIAVAHDGELTDLTDFTATAWFRSTADDRADQVVFGIKKGYEIVFDSAGQRVSDDSVWWAVDNGTGDWAVNPTGAGPLAVGEWHHVALVQDTAADEVRVYVNGSLVATDGGTGPVNGTTGDLGLGVRGDGFGQFVGDVDDVRIYARAFSTSEVQSLYDSA